MSRKKGKLPALHTNNELSYRRLQFEASAADEATRSIPVTLMTGEGVPVYDSKRRKIVTEYPILIGAKLPKQVPLVDSHQHESVRNVLGSIRDLSNDGERITGRAFFGSKSAAREAFEDVREGHITDISAGFFRLEQHYIDEGQSETINGKTYRGPARIVDVPQPFEGSAVTVGADRHSTFGSVPALRAYFDPQSMKDEAMNEAYRTHLVSLGMPEALDDDAALDWAKENVTKREAARDNDQSQRNVGNLDPKSEELLKPGAHDVKTAAEEAVKSARQRDLTIRRSCRMSGLDDTFADKLVEDEAIDVSAASARILDEVNRLRPPVGIRPTKSEHESFRSAVLDGFSMRLGAQVEKPAAGATDFRRTRLLDLMRHCIDREGGSTRAMSDYDIVRTAFSLGASTRASDGQAYLTTGNFSNLLLDAHNKTLLKSFTDTPATCFDWIGMGQSVPDFKNINRVRLGEIGNQPVVPENGEYQDMSLSDSKESYRVEKRGSIVSLTFEAIRNDDLGGFSRLVTLQGSAMKRTINKSVYQILFDNPTLSDGVALFHSSSHGANLVTSDLSVGVLNTAWSAMMLQTGLNSDTILGLTPKFLIVAPGISGDALQLLGSLADPAAGGSTATGNSNTKNIYGPAGNRPLMLIVEALLAGNDTDSWYLATDPMTCDTIELTYLQGEETPVFEQETAFIQDAVKYKVRQTWGVKAIDYRGLYKSTGTG